jgi:hypothetical protein
VDVVLAAYGEVARLGQVPDLEQLCRCHPHLAGEATAFFAAPAPLLPERREERAVVP